VGKSQRDKGARVERAIVKLHLDAGVPCQRVPLSGAAGGMFTGDLAIGPKGSLVGEVKSRKGGKSFKQIEDWLGQNHALFLHRDRQLPMVVLPWAIYERLIHETLVGSGP